LYPLSRDLSELGSVEYRHFPVVSVSNEQRSHAVGEPNFVATIYHGIPVDLYKFVAKPSGTPYLAFLGRISETKRPDWAIESWVALLCIL
jgi:glycosyltransferase involved in cell wall biosynthesis